jgi:nucleotide-binding universal stress UspA family protein
MKLIVTTDGSERSLRVLPAARQFAEAAGADVSLLRVLDPRQDLSGELAPTVKEATERVAARWRVELEEVLRANGIAGQVEIPLRGRAEDIYRVILGAAKAGECDMIAMATRGAGLLRHAFLGSAGMGVLANASVPVMLTSGETDLPELRGTYHVVLTDDGSPASESIIPVVSRVLVPGRMRVTVLYISGARIESDPPEAIRERLEGVRRRLPEGVESQVAIQEIPLLAGVDSAIVAFARENGANAIASATHGHSARRHLVAGSVAMGVLKHSPVPVIMARSQKLA